MKFGKIFIGGLIIIQLTFATLSFAAEVGRYQVVTSGADNAYLVDTATGFVWALGYRTLPTGREPVAMPYKFILITPKTQSNFLVENVPTVPDSMRESK